MDLQSYDQSALSAEQVGDAKNYLIDNLEVDVLLFDGRPIGLTLPNFVDLLVTRADPWAKGDSVAGDSKPVTLETGYTLRVPPFIEEGIKITVDTRPGSMSPGSNDPTSLLERETLAAKNRTSGFEPDCSKPSGISR